MLCAANSKVVKTFICEARKFWWDPGCQTGCNILAKKAIQIPAHNIPSFKPSKDFVENVKLNVKVK